jgi:hypothetical protein
MQNIVINYFVCENNFRKYFGCESERELTGEADG